MTFPRSDGAVDLADRKVGDTVDWKQPSAHWIPMTPTGELNCNTLNFIEQEVKDRLSKIDQKLDKILEVKGISLYRGLSQPVPRRESPEHDTGVRLAVSTKEIETPQKEHTTKSDEASTTYMDREDIKSDHDHAPWGTSEISDIDDATKFGAPTATLQSSGSLQSRVSVATTRSRKSEKSDNHPSVSEQVASLGEMHLQFNAMGSMPSTPSQSGSHGILQDARRHSMELLGLTGSQKRARHSTSSQGSQISTDSHMENIRKTIAAYKQTANPSRSATAATLWDFIENPYRSKLAMFYSRCVGVFIVSSVCVAVGQTLPEFPIQGNMQHLVQMLFESVFTIELVLRFLVCPDRLEFCRSYFNYIDLVSTAPIALRMYILVAAMSGDDATPEEVLGVVAVVPVLRLLKLTRRFEKFQLLLTAFQIAFEALPVLLYTMLLICLIFSAVIYSMEKDDNINITSLPGAIWFIVVTMTTTGYGDTVPETVYGHVITVLLMVLSALYMAMPIGIVGNAFSQVWGDRDRLLLMQRLRDAFLQGGFTPAAIQAIMLLFDADGSGELDLEEFQVMLKTMGINLGDERTLSLFNTFDSKSEGVIDIDRLMTGLFPTAMTDVRISAKNEQSEVRRMSVCATEAHRLLCENQTEAAMQLLAQANDEVFPSDMGPLESSSWFIPDAAAAAAAGSREFSK